MPQRIIYTNPTGGLCVVTPFIGCGLSVGQIALKDVPAGVPYKIVATEDVPSDVEYSLAWESDMSTPDGYGADYGVGSSSEVMGWNEDGTPIIRGDIES
jgi:hypothetical protein